MLFIRDTGNGNTFKFNFPLPHVFPPPPFPLKREPTASALRGDNANAIDFVTIASSLRATSSTRIDKYRPIVMSLRFVRQLRNNTAQSLVLSVKLGVRLLAALRLVFRLLSCTYRV